MLNMDLGSAVQQPPVSNPAERLSTTNDAADIAACPVAAGSNICKDQYSPPLHPLHPIKQDLPGTIEENLVFF